MERINIKDVERKLKELNHYIESKTHKIVLDCAYGGYRLCSLNKKTTGESDISMRLKLREVYNVLYTINNLFMNKENFDFYLLVGDLFFKDGDEIKKEAFAQGKYYGGGGVK